MSFNYRDELEKLSKIVRDNRAFRCAQCFKMKLPNTEGIFIPDGFFIGDPWGTILDFGRKNKWDLSSSKWCIPCARKLLPKRTLWQRIKDVF